MSTIDSKQSFEKILSKYNSKYKKIYTNYLDCVKRSRVYYIRKIAEKIYDEIH